MGGTRFGDEIISMGSNGNQKIAFDCTGCKQRFSAELPRVELINQGRFSMAVAVHQTTVKCPKCGKAFVFFMKSCETVWDASAISEEQRRAIEGSDIISILGGS